MNAAVRFAGAVDAAILLPPFNFHATAAGFGLMAQIASSNTILQTIVEDDKRGRVMSFFTMAFIGMAPFGSLLAGAVASSIGARNTLLVGGLSCLVGAALFARELPRLREKVRPIYVRKGIIREVATGMQTAAESAPPQEEDR